MKKNDCRELLMSDPTTSEWLIKLRHTDQKESEQPMRATGEQAAQNCRNIAIRSDVAQVTLYKPLTTYVKQTNIREVPHD